MLPIVLHSIQRYQCHHWSTQTVSVLQIVFWQSKYSTIFKHSNHQPVLESHCTACFPAFVCSVYGFLDVFCTDMCLFVCFCVWHIDTSLKFLTTSTCWWSLWVRTLHHYLYLWINKVRFWSKVQGILALEDTFYPETKSLLVTTTVCCFLVPEMPSALCTTLCVSVWQDMACHRGLPEGAAKWTRHWFVFAGGRCHGDV